MGEKGAKQTEASAAMAERLLDELQGVGNITSKKMFGGHGVFEDGVMFAMVDSVGTALLRADDETSKEFEALGSERHGRMPYWTIPASVIEDEKLLVNWAERALTVAKTAKR